MRVNKQKCVIIAGRHPAVPRNKRAAVALWQLVAVAALLGGAVYAFFGGWYWALIGLIAMVALGKANQSTAASFIAETARANPYFEAEMRQSGIISD